MRTTAPVLLAIACLVGGQASAQPAKTPKTTAAQKAPKIDPKAKQVIHDMSEFLMRQKAIEVEVDGTTDVIIEDGQKVKFHRDAHVYFERPNKLRSDRKGDLADAQVFYDGKMLTVYARNANAYAQRPAPATLDETVDELYDKVDMDLGPADLVSSNPEKTLMDGATSAKILGPSIIDDVKTQHIAVQGAEVDWELWIEEGGKPLPRKYVITSKKVEGAPQYSVTMSNWKLSADISDETFTFQPPKDAQKIEFVDQIQAAKKKGKK